MKRLTKKDDRGYYLTGDGIYSDWGVPEKFRGEDIDGIATIENILGDDYELDRLRELVEADREGRCVVLPCKVGDVVYEIRYTAENIEPRKHAKKKFDHSVCYGECKRGYLSGIVRPDDYCSRGERKEDNT